MLRTTPLRFDSSGFEIQIVSAISNQDLELNRQWNYVISFYLTIAPLPVPLGCVPVPWTPLKSAAPSPTQAAPAEVSRGDTVILSFATVNNATYVIQDRTDWLGRYKTSYNTFLNNFLCIISIKFYYKNFVHISPSQFLSDYFFVTKKN